MDTPLGEVVAKHEAWINGHEMLCAQRFASTNKQLGLLFAVVGAGMLLILGALGWSLKANYDSAQYQMREFQQFEYRIGSPPHG